MLPEQVSVSGLHDNFGGFSVRLYFAQRYRLIPSKAPVYLTTKAKARNLERAIELLDLETYGFELLAKKWTFSRNRKGKSKDDYPYLYMYASPTHPLCLELELSSNQLSVEFFFDGSDAGLETWVLEQLRMIRRSFGVKPSPVFRILTRTKMGFATEKVNIDKFKIDVARNYNDDFLPIAAEIEASVKEKRSGLILLYGLPGTGKTSYIKSLITRYRKEKFIFIPNDFVNQLLKPEFITFLVRQRNTTLVIEDAEKVVASREHSGGNSVVSNILQLTDGLFSDYLNIKVICTFNTDRSKIDKALLRKGRMIAAYEFGELSPEKTRALLQDTPTDGKQEMTLAEIYNATGESFDKAQAPARIGFGQP